VNRVVNILTVFLICFTCVSLGSATERDICQAPCGRSTVWWEFNVFELKLIASNDPGYALWRGQFDKESLDMQIDVETSDGKKIVKGKILMIGGRVMATQGPVTEPGYELDALDAAVLEQQLVFRLLAKAQPNGPPEIQGVHSIDLKDEKTGIQFATPSAEGYIAPPWHASGAIRVIATDVIEYQLTLTSTVQEESAGTGREHVENLSGRLSKVASAKIDDTMHLDGWDLFGVGVQIRKKANATAFDYSAAPATTTYKTVADIRKKLAQDDYPGEADPSKNFTGFWKKNCKQAFGLQIMPYGTDGKYSVTFCGPGGCGEQGKDGRNTFITKDPDYKVINESEIKVRGAEDWDTYYRCTKDTHPVLKYENQ
jgi:hypothetical protein